MYFANSYKELTFPCQVERVVTTAIPKFMYDNNKSENRVKLRHAAKYKSSRSSDKI